MILATLPFEQQQMLKQMELEEEREEFKQK
jgi:hypothetical protein